MIEPELVFWGVQSVPPLSQSKMSPYYISGMVACTTADSSMAGGGGNSGGGGGLICASTDMKMRYLDLGEPNRDSYIISSAFNFQQPGGASFVGTPHAPQTSAYGHSSQSTSGGQQVAGSASSSSSSSSMRTSEFAPSIMGQSVQYETRIIEGTQVLLELDQQQPQSSAFTSNSYASSSSSSSSSGVSSTASYNSPALTHQSYFTHHQDAISDLIVCHNAAGVGNKSQPLVVTSSRDGSLKIWR